MSSSTNTEHEVRFLEIDVEKIKANLRAVGAVDYGEDMLQEVIFYNKELTWAKEGTLIRLRKQKGKTKLTYKKHHSLAVGGVEEIESGVDNFENVLAILEKTGIIAFRHQEKKRHTFTLGDITFDIDTWPQIPTYIEIEGPNEDALKSAAEKIGLDWKNVEHRDPATVIEGYGLKVKELHWFTFDRVE